MNPPQLIFVDTWGWLAYGHGRDAHHAKVKELVETCRSQRTSVHTSDYVLDELITCFSGANPTPKRFGSSTDCWRIQHAECSRFNG